MMRKVLVGGNILSFVVIGGTIAAFFAVDFSRTKFQELRSVSMDNQLVYKEAKSMQHTLSIAQGSSPAENENSASSLFPSDGTNTIMNAANMPLGDIGPFSSTADTDPGQLAIETAEEQLSRARWKRAKYEEIALKEIALKEQRKAQKQLLRAAHIALKATALKEQRKAQKQLRRETHIEHLERERRRRREAAAEFERAKRWAQKHQVIKQKAEASALFHGAGHEADDSALRKPFSETMASKLKYAKEVEAAEEAHRRALQGQRLVSAVQEADRMAQRNTKTEFQWAKQHAVNSVTLQSASLANLVPAVEMSAGSGGNQKVAVVNPNVPRAASLYSEDESLEEPVWSRSIAHKQQASSIFSAIWHTLTGE